MNYIIELMPIDNGSDYSMMQKDWIKENMKRLIEIISTPIWIIIAEWKKRQGIIVDYPTEEDKVEYENQI